MNLSEDILKFPDNLKRCIDFHGHLCPGLIYGFMVAEKAKELLNVSRACDEEIVVISENNSCAVDALQVLLGATTGKGNLEIKNYGKNAYTVFDRSSKQAYRFSKKEYYEYKGNHKEEFDKLEKAISEKTATPEDTMRYKLLKAEDLLSKKFEDVFDIKKAALSDPPLAKIEKSKKCARCGELTMKSKMIMTDNGEFLCIPCHSANS